MSTTRRAVLRAASTGTALALAGCGDGGGSAATPSSTPEPTSTEIVTVRLFDSSFSPDELSIQPRTEVVWENRDDYAHTVTAASENWTFDVEVAAGESASYTFESTGRYDVYCRFHGDKSLTGMSMRIAVGDATTADG